MKLTYLVEHVEAARIALDLAKREAAHLRYTYDTLFREPMDLVWVEKLSERKDLAEKINASRKRARAFPMSSKLKSSRDMQRRRNAFAS
jgi:hypothetical protein